MPDLKQISMQLELSFWSLTIKFLSESRLLRILLPAIARVFRRDSIYLGMRMALLCSLSGFLVGLIVGVLSIL